MLWIRLDSLSSLLTCRVKQRQTNKKRIIIVENTSEKRESRGKRRSSTFEVKALNQKQRRSKRPKLKVHFFRLSPHQSKPICEHSYALPRHPPQKIINHSEATSSSRPVCNQPVTKVCVEYPVSHAASRFSFV